MLIVSGCRSTRNAENGSYCIVSATTLVLGHGLEVTGGTFFRSGLSTCILSTPVRFRSTVALWCCHSCCGEELRRGGGIEPSPTSDLSVSGRKLAN